MPTSKRQPKNTDFYVNVKGIGSFRFGRRTYGDRIRVRAEFLRVVKELDCGEIDPESGRAIIDPDLAGHASVVAAYRVLMVECPAGWEDLEALDVAGQPENEDKIFEVYEALRSKEDSFRRPQGADEAGKEAGAGNGANDGDVVPAEVQPAAAGPALPGNDAGGN